MLCGIFAFFVSYLSVELDGVLFFSVSAGGGVLYLPGALLYSRRVAPSGKSNSRGTMMGAAGWQITISIMLKFNPSILEMFLSDSQIAK